MGKRKVVPRLSTFIEEMNGLYAKIDVKAGEFTDWADKEFFGKYYEEAFKDLLQDEDYEIIDLGTVQNGYFKKIIQYRVDPPLKIIIYHDKKGVINTALIETTH